MFDAYKYRNKFQETALHYIKKMDIQSSVYVHLYWQNLLNIHSKVVMCIQQVTYIQFLLKTGLRFCQNLIFHSFLHSSFFQISLER